MQAALHGPRRVADAAALARTLVAGERVYMPGSAAEVPGFVDALCDGTAPPVAVTASFVPGINPAPVDRLPAGAEYESMFAQPITRGAQAEGRVRHLPLSYYGFAASMARRRFDTCLVHLSKPGPDGFCSFGAAVEFTSLAVRRSRRVLAVVNPRMPWSPAAERFRLADADAVAEIDAPLRVYDVGKPSAEAQAIARSIASFVRDGATIQIGLGKIPDALLRLLVDRRGLGLHSGMLSDGARLLAEAGSLDPRFAHACCVLVGSTGLYDWLDGNVRFAVRGCDHTHAPATLGALPGLVAVNGALGVDLFGQANLEMLDGRMVSAAGGAPDFARAAALAPDGISIVALPSIGGSARASRIVPRLDGVVSLPRQDVDVVVTECGVADLRGATVMERAERLIAVAAEQHRDGLRDAWREIAGRL